MGQVIFVAFFTAGACCLAILGYATGYYDAIEKMEDEKDDKEEKEADLTNRVRGIGRKHKRIDYNLREGC